MPPVSGQVGSTARALGFAGLLPMLAATGWILLAPRWSVEDLRVALWLAFGYPLLILSFLGGAWWGLAMRAGRVQAAAVLIAVAPTLIALALAGAVLGTGQIGWGLATLGSVVAMTLLVDRGFVASGLAPAGWMALRIPLSLGLGGLTILTGALFGSPPG